MRPKKAKVQPAQTQASNGSDKSRVTFRAESIAKVIGGKRVGNSGYIACWQGHEVTSQCNPGRLEIGVEATLEQYARCRWQKGIFA
jgi:hypothetical protein